MVGTARLYEVDIAHVRADPVSHEVRHRSYLWFVDVDDLPRVPLLARFEPVRRELDAYLAGHGIDLRGGRITMLGNPRSLGYVTLPLQPREGKHVRIEVLGGSDARDAFGGITELVDQGNATTGEEKIGTGELGLLEIEFYETP